MRLAAAVLATLVLAGCGSTSPRRPSVVEVGRERGAPVPSIAPCAEDAGEPATEHDAFDRKVTAICIEGVRAEAKKTIESALRLEPGSLLTERTLREALEDVHRTGVADEIAAYARKLGRGVVVTIRVHERPRVGKVVVEGASVANVKAEQAPGRTPLHPGEHYDPAYAAERARALRDLYAQEGFEDATVTPQVTPAGDGVVDVHMVIHEGARTKIGKITFKGVTPALEAGLLAASGLVRGQPAGREPLADAPAKMSTFYYDRGYVTVSLQLDRGTKDGDGSLPLTVVVTEGPLFRVGKLEIVKSGLDAATTRALLAPLQTKSGAVFRRSALVADLAALKRAFADRGRKVELEPHTEITAPKKTIEIEIEVVGP